jgi:hypothetical protein
MQLMGRLTTLGVVLAVLGGATGCGGSKPESALHKEYKRVRAGACRSQAFNTADCGEEMQKVCESSVGSGSGEPAERHIYCELASQIRAQVKKNEETVALTKEHTPEEEEHRRSNLKAEEKTSHEEEALEKTPGAKKACEEEKRTQEKLRYEHPGSPPEPQREAEYEKLCNR